MRRSIFLCCALAACSKASSTNSAPAPAPKPASHAPAPKPAPVAPLAIAPWAAQDGAAVTTAALQGPFASLDGACKSVKQPTADGFCEHSALDTPPALAAPFLAVESIRATNPGDATPDDGNHPESHWPVVSAAIRTSAGWYVASGLCFSANHTSCDLTASMVGGRLVIAYQSSEASEGRWGSDDESGLVACAAGATGAIACTPKIALARSSASTEDRDDPKGKEDVQLACTGELHPDGHLVVAGNGACAKLAYFGDHPIAF